MDGAPAPSRRGRSESVQVYILSFYRGHDCHPWGLGIRSQRVSHTELSLLRRRRYDLGPARRQASRQSTATVRRVLSRSVVASTDLALPLALTDRVVDAPPLATDACLSAHGSGAAISTGHRRLGGWWRDRRFVVATAASASQKYIVVTHRRPNRREQDLGFSEHQQVY